MIDSLEDVSLKIERAEARIDDLKGEISSFFDAKPYGLVSKIDNQLGIEMLQISTQTPVPKKFKIIIGEILHNLRSSLDQLAYAVAIKQSGNCDKIYFPFRKDINIFERELSKKTKLISPDGQNMIRALKPYRGGNDLLWLLHDLNRKDKHISVVPIILDVFADFDTIIAQNGRLCSVGPRTGRHFIVDPTTTNLTQIVPECAPLIVIEQHGPRIRFEDFGGPKDKFELATYSPGTQFAANFEPIFNIAISDVQISKREPVIAQLGQMRQLVQSIFSTFKDRFFV
jgi:hypothetical protein